MGKNIDLYKYGLSDSIEKLFLSDYAEEGFNLGRVTCVLKNSFKIVTEAGEYDGKVSGKFLNENFDSALFPCVGDWVVVNSQNIINAVLPRYSKISRKVRGKGIGEQIIASNVDYIFLLVPVDKEINMNYIQRALILALEGGMSLIILLSKCDLVDNVQSIMEEVKIAAPLAEVYAISTSERIGISDLNRFFENGKTSVFVGESGVGKSSLINCLSGKDIMKVGDVRENDSEGRHTTTHRQMFLLESGGIVIDTPGMKVLALWGENSSVENIYEDIESVSDNCKFSNCSHTNEPGCAIIEALEKGELSEKRYKEFIKLKNEMMYIASKSKEKLSYGKRREIRNYYNSKQHLK